MTKYDTLYSITKHRIQTRIDILLDTIGYIGSCDTEFLCRGINLSIKSSNRISAINSIFYNKFNIHSSDYTNMIDCYRQCTLCYIIFHDWDNYISYCQECHGYLNNTFDARNMFYSGNAWNKVTMSDETVYYFINPYTYDTDKSVKIQFCYHMIDIYKKHLNNK